MATKECGLESAKKLFDAHEEFDTNTCLDSRMDFHNNAIGRELATSGSVIDHLQNADSFCTQMVMNAFCKGELVHSPEDNCSELKNDPITTLCPAQ
jgi:hypothetical protein